jgi:hypothetical protein
LEQTSTSRLMPAPVGWWLLSSLAASACLALALFATRPGAGPSVAEQRVLRSTPERAADSFIDAYQAGAFERAASFATGTLCDALRARAKGAAAQGGNPRVWVLQESHQLRQDKLRFLGVLMRPDEDESVGWPVALTVVKRDDGFWVEDLHWPKGPPREAP